MINEIREKQLQGDAIRASLVALSTTVRDNRNEDLWNERRRTGDVPAGDWGEKLFFQTNFFDGLVFRTAITIPEKEKADRDQVAEWAARVAGESAVRGYLEKYPDLLKFTVTADIIAAVEMIANRPENFVGGRGISNVIEIPVPRRMSVAVRENWIATGSPFAGETRKAKCHLSPKTGKFHFLSISE